MNEDMYETTAIAKVAEDIKEFSHIKVKRNDVGDDDVEVDIMYCGICHTDVHVANNHLKALMPTQYPCVPGHELAGIATKVGKNVTTIKVGQKVGVGCFVDSCFNCQYCKISSENYCEKGVTSTYGYPPMHGRIKTDLGYTVGGYSDKMTVNKRFVLSIPEEYPLESAGPILCAGITMYAPLIHWGASKGGKKVGIIGIGGLGQMGIKLAKAMGNDVTAISTSPHKESQAIASGASHFVVSTDPDSMASAANSLDLILNTVSANHQCGHYISLMRQDSTQVLLGPTMEPHSIPALQLMMQRKSIAGSSNGGLKEHQDCLDFCQEHNIRPTIELVTTERIPEIYDKLEAKNDSVIRYVLDIKKSLK